MRTPLVTAHQMRAIDSLVIRRNLVEGFSLMKRAGEALAHKVQQILRELGPGTVAIFCGKGNNGGDGFVLARLLQQKGLSLRVFLIDRRQSVQGDALLALESFLEAGGHLEELSDIGSLDNQSKSCKLVVDAMVGTGLRGPLRGLIAEVVRAINGWQIPVLSVDVPSGFDCMGGVPGNPCIRTQWTLLMGFPRVETCFFPSGDFFGKVEVADLQYPNSVVSDCHAHNFTLKHQVFPNLLPKRKIWGDKKDHGVCVLLAGSQGMTGAPALCARAAMRSGAGMVYLGVPSTEVPVLAAKLTEVVLLPLPATETGTIAESGLPLISGMIEKCDAVCVGPGLGLHPQTQSMVHALLSVLNCPVVLDADALNALRGCAKLLKAIPGPVVITPHAAEWSRLFGRLPMSAERMLDRLREVAMQYQITVVYKGNPTVVSTAQGENFVLCAGNSGMAKAGSGDVLAGVITALLAQGCSPVDAALLGVYIHSQAGKLAAQSLGEYSMLPSDVLNCFPQVFKELQDGEKVSKQI